MSKIQKPEIKDRILQHLCETNKGSFLISDIAKSLKLDHDLVYTISDEFEERNFVTLIEVSSADAHRRDKLVTLESRGRVFIQEGGFTNEETQIKNDKKKNSISFYLDVGYKVFAIIGVIGTTFLGIYSNSLNKRIDELNKKVNEYYEQPQKEIQKFENQPLQVIVPDSTDNDTSAYKQAFQADSNAVRNFNN